MFGLRRRHSKAQNAPAALPDPTSDGRVEFSEEQLFDAVLDRLESFMGVDGSWTLVRRDPENGADDRIFSSMSTILLAKDIASVVRGERPSEGPSREAPEAERSESGVVAADTDVRDMLRPIPRGAGQQEQVDLELTTIANWADPQRHDPDYVDPKLVTPSGPNRRARGA